MAIANLAPHFTGCPLPPSVRRPTDDIDSKLLSCACTSKQPQRLRLGNIYKNSAFANDCGGLTTVAACYGVDAIQAEEGASWRPETGEERLLNVCSLSLSL